MATFQDHILRDTIIFIMEDEAPVDATILVPSFHRQVRIESIRVEWTATGNGDDRRLVVQHPLVVPGAGIVSTLTLPLEAKKSETTVFNFFPGVEYLDSNADLNLFPALDVSGITGIRVVDTTGSDPAGDRYRLVVHGTLLRKTT